MDPVEVLRRVPFLGQASPASLARLADRATWHHLVRGQFLFHDGQPANRLYVIADGRVAATATSIQGVELMYHVAGPGEAPGQVDMLHGGSYSASAQALTDVTGLAVPASACREMLAAEPATTLRLAEDLVGIVHALTDSLADLVFLDLRRRLAALLHDLPADGDRVVLVMTQSEMAARLGVVRQSLNSALAKLATSGLIAVESPSVITIIDREALRAFIKSERG